MVQTLWWFYSLAIVLSAAGNVVVETQVTTLATHTARALNPTRTTWILLTDEVDQVRKVVLQIWMALDILTIAQGGTCAILHTQCCVYIPDNKKNILKALGGLNQERRAIQQLTGDPLQEW